MDLTKLVDSVLCLPWDQAPAEVVHLWDAAKANGKNKLMQLLFDQTKTKICNSNATINLAESYLNPSKSRVVIQVFIMPDPPPNQRKILFIVGYMPSGSPDLKSDRLELVPAASGNAYCNHRIWTAEDHFDNTFDTVHSPIVQGIPAPKTPKKAREKAIRTPQGGDESEFDPEDIDMTDESNDQFEEDEAHSLRRSNRARDISNGRKFLYEDIVESTESDVSDQDGSDHDETGDESDHDQQHLVDGGYEASLTEEPMETTEVQAQPVTPARQATAPLDQRASFMPTPPSTQESGFRRSQSTTVTPSQSTQITAEDPIIIDSDSDEETLSPAYNSSRVNLVFINGAGDVLDSETLDKVQ